MAAPAKATTKAMSRGWSASCGATSWCHFHALKAGKPLMPTYCCAAMGGARLSCAGIVRTSTNGFARDQEALMALPPVPFRCL